MKKIKSLTYLLATILLSACSGQSSATFSSSNNSASSEPSSLNSEVSSAISSNDPISSEPISSETPSSDFSSEETSSNITSQDTSSSNSESSSSSDIHSYIDGIDYYDGYYDSLTTWTNGNDLKNKLNAIMRDGYMPLSYIKSNKQNYDSNIDADHYQYDFEYLDVIYSDVNSFKSETNKGWQREHAWCASLMCGTGTGNAVATKGRATDFHNLFAAEAGGNQARGNKNYGKADTSASNYTNRTTNNGNDGYSYSANFEPGNKDKGRLARAIFYMATMYKDSETDENTGITMKGLSIVENPVDYVAGNNCAFAHGNLSELLKWNRLYDVDFLEMQHNISVYTNTNNPDGVAQGNRNPYVDYPELVDYVYGNKQDQAGSLKNLIPSAYYLHMEEKSVSHYALKEANRNKGYGETISQDDYKVVAIYTDYSSEIVTEGLTHSWSNRTFEESDGEKVSAKISTPKNDINYDIVLNPMISCSTGVLPVDKTGIDNTKPNIEQSVSYGDVDFYLSYSTTASGEVTLSNDNQNGGFKFGSGNKPITGITFKTKQSYTIDKAYIKAYASNTSSSYRLTIKVGETTLVSNVSVSYNSAKYKIYGGQSNTALTGQITFIFTGSNAINVNSIAFNNIIA